MRTIKKFNESWQTPFGKIDPKIGEDEKTSGDFLGRKFRSILNDKDVMKSQDQIRDMIKSGEFDSMISAENKKGHRPVNGVDWIYSQVLDKGRYDIADIIFQKGHIITDKEGVAKWLRDDDAKYSVNRYTSANGFHRTSKGGI